MLVYRSVIIFWNVLCRFFCRTKYSSQNISNQKKVWRDACIFNQLEIMGAKINVRDFFGTFSWDFFGIRSGWTNPTICLTHKKYKKKNTSKPSTSSINYIPFPKLPRKKKKTKNVTPCRRVPPWPNRPETWRSGFNVKGWSKTQSSTLFESQPGCWDG